MATKPELLKEQRIKKEKSRLKGVFKDLDANKMKVVLPLIDNAAFMIIALKDLEEIIAENGYTVEYQNGEHQHGTKQSDEVKTHIAMSKNLAVVLRTLADLVPAAKKKKSALQALKDE
jgi:hypothetical protein